MTDSDVNRLRSQVEQLTTAQLYALVRWLFLYWALRAQQDVMQSLGKKEQIGS